MRTVRRIGLALGALGALVGYVWVSAARAVPEVKRRKAATRSARRGA